MEPSDRVTLVRLASLAAVLYRLRVVWIVVGLAAAVWFGALMLQAATPSARALVPLSVLVWMALALGIAYTLTRAPPAVVPGEAWLTRIRKRLVQAGFGLAVAAMLGLGGFALFLSWRAFQLTV